MKTASFLIAVFCAISALAQAGPGNRAEMSIPGVPGILQLDVGATTFQTAVTPDGKEVQLRAFDRPDHLGISAFLQRYVSGEPRKMPGRVVARHQKICSDAA
ncbi:MAG: hypothetical protein ACXVZH_02405 [Terriglobales bacterium]